MFTLLIWIWFTDLTFWLGLIMLWQSQAVWPSSPHQVWSWAPLTHYLPPGMDMPAWLLLNFSVQRGHGTINYRLKDRSRQVTELCKNRRKNPIWKHSSQTSTAVWNTCLKIFLQRLIKVVFASFPGLAAQCLQTEQLCPAEGWSASRESCDYSVVWGQGLTQIVMLGAGGHFQIFLLCFVFSLRLFSCQVFSLSNKNKRLNCLKKTSTFQKLSF